MRAYLLQLEMLAKGGLTRTDEPCGRKRKVEHRREGNFREDAFVGKHSIEYLVISSGPSFRERFITACEAYCEVQTVRRGRKGVVHRSVRSAGQPCFASGSGMTVMSMDPRPPHILKVFVQRLTAVTSKRFDSGACRPV